MPAVATSTKKTIKRDVVVLDRNDFEEMRSENRELRLALKAIVAGEFSLRHGRTKNLKLFLKSRLPNHAQNK